MAGTDFFIRPASGTSSADWLRLPNADISVVITRRITRTVLHGGEGDDLVDEGAESAVYTVRGEMDYEDYKKILKMFRSGQPYIHDPFEERDVKVFLERWSMMDQRNYTPLNSLKIYDEVNRCAP